MANIRAAYAEVVSSALTGDKSSTSITETNGIYSETVTLTQTKPGWQSDVDLPTNLNSTDNAQQPTAKQTVTITSTETGATIDIAITKATD